MKCKVFIHQNHIPKVLKIIFKIFFNGRLHTTREVLFFLNNYNDLTLYNDVNISLIYGGIHGNKNEKDRANNFVRGVKKYGNFKFSSIDDNLTQSDITTFIMEISSKKIYYNSNNQPYSDAYLKLYHKNTTNLNFKKLLKNDLEIDILNIKNILKNKFNIEKLIIITHFNINEKNNIIFEKRQLLIDELKQICCVNDITFINPVEILKII
jgi:hypothetical protein